MTGASLILVRHARPKIDPDTPPAQWELCPDGIVAAEKLADKLARFSPVACVTSSERKAQETAKVLADKLKLPLDVDPMLGEHKRQHASFGTEAEFQARIAEVFAHPHQPAPGGESAEQACERLAAALAAHKARPLLAVTHGTVLSLYVARLLNVDAHDVWRNLRTPDAFVFDANGTLLERLS